MPEWKKAKARSLRSSPTPAERVLWDHLRLRRFHGLKFRRQAPMLGYIADFYCPAARLVVEVDGHGHDVECDRVRDTRLARTGVRVVRLPNSVVLRDPARALATIREVLA